MINGKSIGGMRNHSCGNHSCEKECNVQGGISQTELKEGFLGYLHGVWEGGVSDHGFPNYFVTILQSIKERN